MGKMSYYEVLERLLYILVIPQQKISRADN